MRRALALFVPFIMAAMLGVGGAQAAEHNGRTIVSFTFSGGYRGQEQAAEILAKYGLAGTFYVNADYIGRPAYMSVDQLRSVVRNRSEIGGASLHNADLTTLTGRRLLREICDDRATLTALGFPATSFAYPRGNWSYPGQVAAEKCGYNSARDLAGLRLSNSHCGACPVTETSPPRNPMSIRTVSPQATVWRIKRLIVAAEHSPAGWLPLAFSHVCSCPGRPNALTPLEFEQLVAWVAARPASTRVHTVDQVIGGDLKATRGTPLERFVTIPASPLPPPKTALSRIPAWTILGVPIGQAQLVYTGLLLAVAIVVTFRLASRSNRYAK